MKKLVLLLVVTILLSACAEAPSANPDAETPIDAPDAETSFYIDGAEMVISSVTTAESFSDHKPTSASDAFLIVSAEMLSKPDTVEVNELDFKAAASLEGVWGRADQASIVEVYSGFVDSDKEAFVKWGFIVPRTAQSFTLVLPDEQFLVLDSFLTE